MSKWIIKNTAALYNHRKTKHNKIIIIIIIIIMSSLLSFMIINVLFIIIYIYIESLGFDMSPNSDIELGDQLSFQYEEANVLV